jgi:hypothetical protein
MTTSTRTRVNSPAYYLGRPAALWLTAFARRPGPGPAGPGPAGRTPASCASEVRGPAADHA